MGYDSTLTGKQVQDAVEKVESLDPVATSGSYNDLKDKPTIPTNISELNGDATHRTVTDDEKNTWNSKASMNDVNMAITNAITNAINASY